MKRQLRIPAALAVVVLTGAGMATATSCGGEDPPARPDAPTSCTAYCMPFGGSGDQNCPFPTCADLDGPGPVCPADCTAEPLD